MYYPFILYFNEYVFNLAAHKTAVKPLCNVFLLSPPSAPAKAGFCTSLHSIYWEKSVPKKKNILYLHMLYGHMHFWHLPQRQTREGGNLFTVLWGVLERAKKYLFNRLYSIKNMSFTVLRTQKKTSHLLTRYFFDA